MMDGKLTGRWKTWRCWWRSARRDEAQIDGWDGKGKIGIAEQPLLHLIYSVSTSESLSHSNAKGSTHVVSPLKDLSQHFNHCPDLSLEDAVRAAACETPVARSSNRRISRKLENSFSKTEPEVIGMLFGWTSCPPPAEVQSVVRGC